MTKEEILKAKGITKDTRHHDYDYLYRSVLEAMEEYKAVESPVQSFYDSLPYECINKEAIQHGMQGQCLNSNMCKQCIGFTSSNTIFKP